MQFRRLSILLSAQSHVLTLSTTVGAPLAGRISDRLVKKWRKRRAGEWVPEDRLRGTLFGAAFLVPVSVLFSGLITHFIEGKVGLGLNLICLFLNGLGVSFPNLKLLHV
jgi:MFS family permease